jgi:hypothetical protein
MDNSPVISMTFRSPVPGADRDVWDRFNNWSREAYTPLTLKQAGRIGCDFYQIVRESPQYPLTGYVLYTENIIAVEKSLETAEHKAIQDELNNWSQRGIVEFIWRVRYALLKSLKSTPDYPPRDRATTPKTAITHLEAYSRKKRQHFMANGCRTTVSVFFSRFFCGCRVLREWIVSGAWTLRVRVMRA